MMVSFDSGSMYVWNVGSSFVKRFKAFDIWAAAFLSLGLIDKEITGLGTYIEAIETFNPPEVNVSPEAQSTPNKATMSPEPASLMSSIWAAFMRTRRPTLKRLRLRVL